MACDQDGDVSDGAGGPEDTPDQRVKAGLPRRDGAGSDQCGSGRSCAHAMERVGGSDGLSARGGLPMTPSLALVG